MSYRFTYTEKNAGKFPHSWRNAIRKPKSGSPQEQGGNIMTD